MENKSKLKSQLIYIHSLMAMLLIQFTHKLVREIPGAFNLPEAGTGGRIAVSVIAGLTLISILLIAFRRRCGVYLGLLTAAFMIIQPILIHIIKGVPDQNGVWWYPIFPWLQAILIIVFSFKLLRNERKI